MIDEIKTKVRALWLDGLEPSQIAASVGAAIDDVRALLGLKVLVVDSSEARPAPPPQDPEPPNALARWLNAANVRLRGVRYARGLDGLTPLVRPEARPVPHDSMGTPSSRRFVEIPGREVPQERVPRGRRVGW
jgi:hypothetical protein